MMIMLLAPPRIDNMSLYDVQKTYIAGMASSATFIHRHNGVKQEGEEEYNDRRNFHDFACLRRESVYDCFRF